MTILPGHGRAQLPVELVKARMCIGAEIGVQAGEHAEALLRAGVRKLYLVDVWAKQDGYFDLANVGDAAHRENLRLTLARIAAFPFQATILAGWSHEAAEKIPDGALDFIYLDANHKLSAVREDLLAWYPKVKPGGWVCGHDFLDSPNCCGSEFGVETAVREFCASRGLDEIHVCQDEPFPNWHFLKPHTRNVKTKP